MSGLDVKFLAKLRAAEEQRLRTCLLSRAARVLPLSHLVFNPCCPEVPRHVPTKQNPSVLKVVDQKRTGRCWMMAGLNLLRHQSAPQLGLKDFELSGSYVMFFDKLEKCILFLDNFWAVRAEPEDSRGVQYLLQNPISDGGQFSMFVDLVEKYGVVPVEVMPDTRHASQTHELNDQLANVLRYYAAVIRQAKDEDQKHQVVWDCLKVVFRLLVATLGLPPQSFRTGPESPVSTPQQFYRSLQPRDLSEYVALISVPQADRPFNRCFEVAGLGTMCGGRPVRYLNVELDIMKKSVMLANDRGRRVWFGSDVSKDRHEGEGLLDPAVFDWPLLLGADLRLPRDLRLKYRQTAVSHAMVIEGYHADPQTGQPTCFRVENTWGDAHKSGFLEMSSKWFDEFVFEVLVPPDVLSGFLLGIWQTDQAIQLPLWDPLGMLLGSCCEREESVEQRT